MTIHDLESLAFPPTVHDHLRAARRGRAGVSVPTQGQAEINALAGRETDTGTIRSGLVLAIDPGTDESGWCAFDGADVSAAGVMPNAEMLAYLQRGHFRINGYRLALEMVASYGMPVGREVFETVRWIGRYQQAWHAPEAVELVYRKDVKLHLCGSPRAKDANIRRALLDLFPRTGGGKTPQIGTKAKPGPLYGVSSHAWAALAVAVYACRKDRMEAAQ